LDKLSRITPFFWLGLPRVSPDVTQLAEEFKAAKPQDNNNHHIPQHLQAPED